MFVSEAWTGKPRYRKEVPRKPKCSSFLFSCVISCLVTTINSFLYIKEEEIKPTLNSLHLYLFNGQFLSHQQTQKKNPWRQWFRVFPSFPRGRCRDFVRCGWVGPRPLLDQNSWGGPRNETKRYLQSGIHGSPNFYVRIPNTKIAPGPRGCEKTVCENVPRSNKVRI